MRVTTAQDLGNLVRETREAKAMTQRQLAALAGVSRLWLVHVEAGHPGAEFGRILHLVASLDLALDLVERHSESTWGDLLAQDHTAVVPTAPPSSGQDR
jgi:HTH-type transcriptional regulator/antitoxin HipB